MKKPKNIPNELVHTYKNQDFAIKFTDWKKIKDGGFTPENTYHVVVVGNFNEKGFYFRQLVSYEYLSTIENYLDFICEECIKAAKKAHYCQLRITGTYEDID